MTAYPEWMNSDEGLHAFVSVLARVPAHDRQEITQVQAATYGRAAEIVGELAGIYAELRSLRTWIHACDA